MKKTIQEIAIFNNVSSARQSEQTKLGYAIKKVGKQLDKIIVGYQEKLEDLRISLCSVDEKENVIKNEKDQYVYTRENLALFTSGARDLSKEEYEIEPFICTELPKDLTEQEIEVFTGFVI
jgi:hypothetical protein